jgi:hypothetical protein
MTGKLSKRDLLTYFGTILGASLLPSFLNPDFKSGRGLGVTVVAYFIKPAALRAVGASSAGAGTSFTVDDFFGDLAPGGITTSRTFQRFLDQNDVELVVQELTPNYLLRVSSWKNESDLHEYLDSPEMVSLLGECRKNGYIFSHNVVSS